jgi:glutamate synthase (ferredoxin)
VLDEPGDLAGRVNQQMVGIEPLKDAEEIAAVRALIEKHQAVTGSKRAQALLADWDRSVASFVKVMPKDYQRVLTAMKRAHDQGLSGDAAVMAAFEENARDLARVGGN